MDVQTVRMAFFSVLEHARLSKPDPPAQVDRMPSGPFPRLDAPKSKHSKLDRIHFWSVGSEYIRHGADGRSKRWQTSKSSEDGALF